jgi:hypothetical protein
MTAAATRTWMVKTIVTDYGGLQTTNGVRVRVGSSSSANYDFVIAGTDSPVAALDAYPAKGGIIVVPVDPNITGYRDATAGSPNLASVDFFGNLAAFSSSTAKSENVGLDAIDVGTGLTLTAGDGVSADGTFQDFLDHDEGTTGNRYGYCTSISGVFFVFGTLTIGSATATEFTDSGQTIVFPDGMFQAGFSGIAIDLQNASTAVNISSCVLIGRGNATTEETRPELNVTGTSGTATIDGNSLANFASIVLSSGATFSDNTVTAAVAMTQNDAVVSGNIFDAPDVATGVAFMTSDNPADLSDNTFISGGVGHAIEIDTTGTYSFSGNKFTGYGAGGSNDAAIYNNSGGAVTINVTGGGDTPTIRNGASASTTVNSNVSITLTGMRDNTEVRVFEQGTTTVVDGIEDATAGTPDDRSFTFTTASGNAVDIRIINKTYVNQAILNFSTTADTSLPIQQQFDRNYRNP